MKLSMTGMCGMLPDVAAWGAAIALFLTVQHVCSHGVLASYGSNLWTLLCMLQAAQAKGLAALSPAGQ